MPILIKKPEPSGEKLAVTLTDLDRLPTDAKARYLGGRLDLAKTVKVGAGIPAVAFKCDLLQAALVCDLLRSEDRKAGDAPTGVWVKRRDSWYKVSERLLLTLTVADEGALNPDLFADAVIEGAPVEAEYVDL